MTFSVVVLSALLVLASCGASYPAPDVYRLSNGDFLVQHEGRVWQVAGGDVSRVVANLRARGTPYYDRTQDWVLFEECVNAGGMWRFDHRYCYWPLRSSDRRVRP